MKRIEPVIGLGPKEREQQGGKLKVEVELRKNWLILHRTARIALRRQQNNESRENGESLTLARGGSLLPVPIDA